MSNFSTEGATERVTEWARELDWEAFSVAAMRAHLACRNEEAQHYWNRAHNLSLEMEPDDPRVATTINNYALGKLVTGDVKEARKQFEKAGESWEKGLTWTSKMTVQLPARSSLFHQRMEQRHMEAFTTVRRSRHKDLLAGAAALTKFNLGISLLFEEEDERADDIITVSAEEREKSFGPRDPDLATILAVLAGRCEIKGDAGSANAFEGKAFEISKDPARNSLELWYDEMTRETNDTRRLLSAAYLTASARENNFL